MVSVLLLYALDFRRLAEPHPGQAHSGVSDGQQNLFDNPTNIQLIMNALTYLTQQLVKQCRRIQLLNEPSNVDSLPSFCGSLHQARSCSS